MSDYKFPFEFSDSGYGPIGVDSSVSDLASAINVVNNYQNYTYTYKKSCLKYVIGYSPGQVQIIKGPCIYAGIRDLGASLAVTEHRWSDLPATINSILDQGQVDLPSYCLPIVPSDLRAAAGGHLPGELPASLEGVKFKGYGDLKTFLGGHAPGDINAYLGAHKPIDLPTLLNGIKHKGDGNITSTIDTHAPSDVSATVATHRAGNLGILLRGWRYEAPWDLPSSIRGWQEGDIRASIDTHTASNLEVRLRGWALEAPADLPSSIRGYTERTLQAVISTHTPRSVGASLRPWYRNVVANLSAFLGAWQQQDFPAQIDTHMWSDLGAKVLPHPPPPVTANIRGWVRELAKSLGASTYGWQAGDLPTSIGGHYAGNLGILLRAWKYGAVRDLSGYIHGWQELDLTASIKPHIFGELGVILRAWSYGTPQDFPANIHGWQESNLGMTTKGGHSPSDMQGLVRIFQHEHRDLGMTVHSWEERFFKSEIYTHLPRNVRASIRGFVKSHSDLRAASYGWQPLDLPALISTHAPSLLGAIIKVADKTSALFPASIHGWEWRSLGMTLAGTHAPSDISAYLNAQEQKIGDLPAVLRGWQASYLKAKLNMVYPSDLTAYLLTVQPEDLNAYIKARLYGNLKSVVNSYDIRSLGAYLKRVYDKFLPAKLNVITDYYRNLGVTIKIHGEGQSDLPAFAEVFMWRTLAATLIPKYRYDLSGYVFPIVPKNLKGILHGWEERFLQGVLNGQDYPWNLTAYIYSSGEFRNLTASIASLAAADIYKDLNMRIHSWQRFNLPSYIFAANAVNLSAYLQPRLQAGDLHATILPKMIRLTTLVKIPTLVARDLSAIINYPCMKTGYSNLNSFIWAKYKGDLFAFVRGIISYKQPELLGAKVGYTDSYMEEDTYKIGINLMPSEYFTEDVYTFRMSVLASGNFLNAYIRPTPRFTDFTAYINGEDLPSYTYEELFRNREKVVNKTYDGVFKSFEVAEIAFESAVREYYYSSEGSSAWKANRFDRWLLDVRSILPANLSVRLKRRLHRATTVYDLRRFVSVDDAIKTAIAYVTEWPQASLGATIYNRGRYEQLGATISPRYIRSAKTVMPATIVPKQKTVVVGGVSSITKIE